MCFLLSIIMKLLFLMLFVEIRIKLFVEFNGIVGQEVF